MTKLNQWKHDLGQAWTSLAQGWQELGERASSALTWFKPGGDDKPPAKAATQDVAVFGGWSFMAADVFDDDDRVVVRLEAPGMRRDDFDIQLRDDMLSVYGEKRFENEASQGRYRLVQCAYGSFRRDIRLPVTVRADKTRASYRDGVLRIECPKADHSRTRRVAVQTG